MAAKPVGYRKNASTVRRRPKSSHVFIGSFFLWGTIGKYRSRPASKLNRGDFSHLSFSQYRAYTLASTMVRLFHAQFGQRSG